MTTTMSHMSSGLVQRKRANIASSDTGNENRPDNDDYPDEEEDHDSKETRLTLMEEILLLGLKDREHFRTHMKLLILVNFCLKYFFYRVPVTPESFIREYPLEHIDRLLNVTHNDRMVSGLTYSTCKGCVS
ncbi:hypothetical protein KUTeg_018042 [Tegillarca granosa]|uniref:Uncharacterized protein n=1 Tax=Tegillarca granosa TaxID=220873 RepID=A0ABQ9EGP0_TEGGR|nr:hypothetical protein KUTeg_018042 [Tegillarca granosa]